MALPYDKMRVIYDRVMKHKLVDQIALYSPLFEKLFSQKKLEGGAGIIAPLRYARNNNLVSPSPYEDPDFQAPDGPTALQQNYTFWTQMIAYSKQEDSRATATPDDLKAITNYLGEKLEQAQDALEFRFATAIFGDGSDMVMPETGNIVSTFPGLRKIISQSNTVHGIAQGTYTWWQSDAVDTATTTYADFIDSTNANYVLTVLPDAIDNCTHNTKRPNLVVTTKLIQRAIKESISSKEQFNKFENAPENASISWQYVDFEGIPVIADEICPAGYIFILNTDHLYLAGNPNSWFEMSEFTKKGDAFIADIDVDTALICDSPRHQGIISSCPISRT